MTKNPFVGTWRLVSFETRSEDGQVSYPQGKNPVGYIIYSEDGYMAVAIMSANRRKFTAKDLKKGSTEVKAAAADTYTSYCGRYEIQKDAIIHHPEVSLFPNWVGVKLKRLFRFEGNRLSLSTLPLVVDGIQQYSHLIWERVSTI